MEMKKNIVERLVERIGEKNPALNTKTELQSTQKN